MVGGSISLSPIDLENFRYDAEKCTGCKGCAWVDHIYMPPDVKYSIRCPSLARYLFDAYGAYGREKIAVALMDGKIDYSPVLSDVIYRCQLCGACDAGCKRNLDLEPLLVLEALRIKCVRDGHGPLPEQKRVIENVLASHNRYGAPHKDRLSWLPSGIELDARPKILYFAGCAASYTHREIAQSTVQILRKTGVTFTVLDDEWCCGFPAYSVGDVETAQKLVTRNLEAISESGVDTVLTSCAECYKSLKVDYPKLLGKSTSEMGFKVLHLVEFVEEQIRQDHLRLGSPVEMKATYHDSCHLARLSEPWVHWEGERGQWGVLNPPRQYRRGTHGVYQEPRDILEGIPGLELVEMTRIRENAWCCGAGGGVRDGYNDFAVWTAGQRLNEAKETGAEAIVCACPYCKDNFMDAIKKDQSRIGVYDISELILQSIS